MRAWPVLVALLACKGDKDKDKATPAAQPQAQPQAAKPPPLDWAACDAAIVKAQSAPLAARPAILLDACHACGDWKPLFAWATPSTEGGPKRELIEQTMTACNAFCTGDAREKFMGLLDKARGTASRAPWRQLGASCKLDERFMSPAYFALDRIARAAATRGGETANHLAALEVPLPLLTANGEGPVLAEAGVDVSPNVGRLQITLLGGEIYVGTLPRAKLVGGVQPQLGDAGYPGEAVKLAKLAARLRALAGTGKEPIALIAPRAMPAAQLVPVVAEAAKVAPVQLVAKANESPEGWPLAGVIPTALEAGKDLAIGKAFTVENLAKELVTRKEPKLGLFAN